MYVWEARASGRHAVRRRRVTRVLVGGVCLALLGWGLGQELLQPSTWRATPTVTVTVRPGQTLWEIASRGHPNTDVRDEVAEIERLNRLEGPLLRPGMRLRVPAA